MELLIQEHDKHPNNPYLFPSPLTGEMYHPDSVVNLRKKLLKDTGLEHFKFHDLRHLYVKHTTKNISLQKQKSQITNDNLIVWGFCFHFILGLQSVSIYSKRDYQKSERLAKKQNMLQQQFKVDEPNRVWVSDITCFNVNGKYLYVCVILDLFSRKVVAHRVLPKNSTYLVTSTFRQAYQNRNEPQQLMFHHCDQGSQYASNTFRKLLRTNKVVQSFSKSGRPHDNAVAESFFSSMKREEIYRTQYRSERQFMESVDTYIEFYNTKRPHSTLNYKTPDGFELLHAQRKGRAG